MHRHLRFFADYFASFPLWSGDGSSDPDELRESLPLTAELRDDLVAWVNAYTARDLSGMTDEERARWYVEFDRAGLALRDRVQAELGADTHVEYRFMTSELERSSKPKDDGTGPSR